MTARSVRPSPDRVIETNRVPVYRFGEPASAPHRSPEVAADRPFWAIAGVVCLIALAVVLVAADGVARAFVRPDACLTLSAQECAAMLQERAAK